MPDIVGTPILEIPVAEGSRDQHMPTLGFVKKFRKEFEDHLDGKPCPFAKHGAGELVEVH